MTVCRYFQKGYCRNGDSCRFEHLQYNNRAPLLTNPSYQQQSWSGNQTRSGGGDRRPEQTITEQVLADVDLMLRGKHYNFTCVPGRQPHLNCRGFSDLSPEEIRAKFLELQASNNQQRFLSEMSAHKDFVERALRNLLQNPSILDDVLPPHTTSVVQSSTIPTNIPTGNAAPNPSFFGSAPILGNFNSQPTFGQTQANVQIQQPVAPMMPMMNVAQSQTLFGKPIQSSTSIFSQSPQAAIGQVPQAPTVTFNPVVPPPTAVPVPIPTIDTTPAPVSFQKALATQRDEEMYTPMEKLSSQDVAAFQDRAFTIGTIPLVPPAREFCFQ